jgi:hypothetical protein
MSAVLRASGVDLAIDDFLAGSKLVPISIFRKGELRFPASQPNGRKHERSGANFSASDADMSDFELQLAESELFLRDFASEIRSLRAFPGLDGLSLDFGVETKPPHWSSFTFPFSLVAAAGELQVDLGISVYPSGDDSEADETQTAEQDAAEQPATAGESE